MALQSTCFPLYNSPKRRHTEHNCLSRTNEEGPQAPLLTLNVSYDNKHREEMGFVDSGKVSDSGGAYHGGCEIAENWSPAHRKMVVPGWLRSSKIFYCSEMGHVPTEISHLWQMI